MHDYSFLKDPYNIGLVLIVLALIVLATYLQAFEQFYTFSRSHEGWELDELLTGFAVTSAMLPVVLVRWNWLLSQANRSIASAKQHADHVALHDPLTGLHNRR